MPIRIVATPATEKRKAKRGEFRTKGKGTKDLRDRLNPLKNAA